MVCRIHATPRHVAQAVFTRIARAKGGGAKGPWRATAMSPCPMGYSMVPVWLQNLSKRGAQCMMLPASVEPTLRDD